MQDKLTLANEGYLRQSARELDPARLRVWREIDDLGQAQTLALRAARPKSIMELAKEHFFKRVDAQA